MDLLLINGKGITMDATRPFCQAVAIKDGYIQEVGTNEEILCHKKSGTQIIDLQGKMLVPGFNDSHMHLLNYGLSLDMIDLTGSTSIQELILRGRHYLSNSTFREQKWIMGRGWNQDSFDEKRFPTRYDLDQISTEHPICFSRACGHVAVVNSKALLLAGIHGNTPQIEGGHFDVDSTGEPLGIFRESALALVFGMIPDPTMEEIEEIIKNAAEKALAQGITSIQTDDFEALPSKNFQKVIQAYTSLREKNQLPVRIYQQCLLPTPAKLNQFISLGYHTGQGDAFFKLGPLKLLCDGSLGARTAYLCEPYADDPSTRGIAVYTQEELDELVRIAHTAGMQTAIHCIGDGIMYMAFDSIVKAQHQQPRENMRHGIIHCQITDPALLKKYRDHHVIAYIQPIFLDYDLHIVEDRVGKERAKTTYNWKTLLDLGVHVACGSDCPVEPFDVLPGIYAAVTRKDLKGYPEEGWLPEQKLSVEQALYAFTQGGAYASFEENIKGSITPGKVADLVLLSADLFEIDPDDIKNVQVLMTIVDGKILYEKK